MAATVLNNIINDKINVDSFIKWLLKLDSQVQYFDRKKELKCSRMDFLTYFLNFLHENISSSSKIGESSQKGRIYTPNGFPQIEKIPEKVILSSNSYVRTKSSFPNLPVKSVNETEKLLDQIHKTSSKACHSSSKLSRIHPESVPKNDLDCPISPLHRQQNTFCTPKNERQSFTSKSLEKTSTLCLGDFIVNKKSSTKKKSGKVMFTNDLTEESCRRIKPTCLSQLEPNCNFRKSSNSFSKFLETEEVSAHDLNDNRNLLAKERLCILSRTENKSTMPILSSKKILCPQNFKGNVEADASLVTNKKQLNYMVEIYISILKNNLVLNITSEIYFLLSLLLINHFNEVKEDTSTNSAEGMLSGIDFLRDDEFATSSQVIVDNNTKELQYSDLFETVHNIVYFAVRCLESQIDILKNYDKSTLNLLSQNKRMQMFSNSLAKELSKISEEKSERVHQFHDGSLETNVCFNLDTDNRNNFPSDAAFHAFRKQRDMFYDILRIWEAHHLDEGWSFSTSLGQKIKNLLNVHNEPAVFVHFSRLFKSQLLRTCGTVQREEEKVDMSFLSSIPNIDADKLNRLNCRLVTKQCSKGMNSVPLFTGHQEFYKDFIISASNYTFNKHLCDTIITEMVELNSTNVFCTDLEEIDDIDALTRESYMFCIISLRILAKFLGFVESLPYKTECNTFSEKVLNFQISSRKEVTPIFDIKKLLEHSINKKTIILTIPWVVKYLSMLDYITLRLPYYISVHKILFELYINCKMLGNKTQSSNYNNSLIKFCLGWLFELPHFPDSEYYNFYTTTLEGGALADNIQSYTVKVLALDDLDIIDQNILYICCPFLQEIKLLLSSTLNRSVTVKHITPLTAVQSANEIANKKLQQQLGEAFFNGQPPSVRKSVEYVSERIASVCIKHICSTIVPSAKKTALNDLREFFVSWNKQHNVHLYKNEQYLKTALASEVNGVAHSSVMTLKATCSREVASITKKRIPLSVSNLFTIDVLPHMVDVCVIIATRMCSERIQQWVNKHITVAVFTKDFDKEMQMILYPNGRKTKEKSVFLLPSCGTSKKHNPLALSGSHLLDKIKDFSLTLLENPSNVREEEVLALLENAYVTFTERSDVNDYVIKTSCILTIDLSLILITQKPDLMLKNEVLKNFIRVWKCYSEKITSLFKNILSPKNVMLLAQSCNGPKVWETIADFMAFLLNENVLTPEDFEAQCTKFYRNEWDEDTLNNFTRFLKKCLNCYKSFGGNMLLLEFLSDFCADL